MDKASSLAATLRIDQVIYTVRGQRVILDSDLAAIYGVSTKALNQAVKRNTGRFPSDFASQLDPGEIENVRAQSVSACKDEANRSQFVTGSQKHRDPRFRPYAFTEHGALMAASALNSEQAIQLNIQIQEDL